MKTYLTCIAILVFVQNCDSKKDHASSVDIAKYEFIDSVVYQPKSKILVGISSSDQEEHRVSIQLLQRTEEGLKVIQAIDSLDTQFGNTIPIFKDFNQDGLMDIKLEYGSGARGANTLSHLLIQEPTGLLRYIKGSSDIPNIELDSMKHIITGTYFYAGISFVDFVLKKDTLIGVSGTDVSVDSIWTIREHYKFEGSKQVILSRDSVADNGEGMYTWDQ